MLVNTIIFKYSNVKNNVVNLENLKELGLSEGQISVYSAVLELGISTINKIQEKTGIERRNIYDILNKLIEKGLISYTLEKGKRTYQCTHPNKIREEIKQTLEEYPITTVKEIVEIVDSIEDRRTRQQIISYFLYEISYQIRTMIKFY